MISEYSRFNIRRFVKYVIRINPCNAQQMINVYEQKIAVIKELHQESADSKRFVLQGKDRVWQSNFDFMHGQFLMIGLAGFGEAPFDICGSRQDRKKQVEITIRVAGSLTERLHGLKKGDEMLIRGPFGNGFPGFEELPRKNLLLVGGGCGAVTLRSILEEYCEKKHKFDLQVFWGCLNEDTLLFKNRHVTWKKNTDFNLILEKPKKSWKGERGLVTKLFDKKQVIKDATVLVVGPPIMYKFLIPKLKEHGFSDSDIYLSLERRMYCGVGVCQHCAVGQYYVCKDGPVFRYDVINDVNGVI